MFVSVSALFLTSCDKVKTDSPFVFDEVGNISAIKIADPQSNDTKVSFNDNESVGLELEWQVDDVITVYGENGNIRVGNFKCSSVNSENVATFDAMDNITLKVNTGYISVYPESSKSTLVDRDAEMIEKLNNQVASTDGSYEHLDDYLFMKSSFTTTTSADTYISFDYEISALVLSIPWSTSIAPKSITFEDKKATDLGGNYTIMSSLISKLTSSNQFNVENDVCKVYMMILPNAPKQNRGFKVSVNDGSETVSFNSKATCDYFSSGKTYRITVPENAWNEEGDYIDEWGINQGQGKTINGVTWAPVNLGYQPAASTNGCNHKGYPYGKHYQWGRIHGQGASQEDNVSSFVAALARTDEPEANKFYYGPSDGSVTNWASSAFDDDGIGDNKIGALEGYNEWGSESSQYSAPSNVGNPCPEGYKVPNVDEFLKLTNGIEKDSIGKPDSNNHHIVEGKYSEYVYSDVGVWYSGNVPIKDATDDQKIFFPAAGLIWPIGEGELMFSNLGFYWSSTIGLDYEGLEGWNAPARLYFGTEKRDMDYAYHSFGFSIRCVTIRK